MIGWGQRAWFLGAAWLAERHGLTLKEGYFSSLTAKPRPGVATRWRGQLGVIGVPSRNCNFAVFIGNPRIPLKKDSTSNARNLQKIKRKKKNSPHANNPCLIWKCKASAAEHYEGSTNSFLVLSTRQAFKCDSLTDDGRKINFLNKISLRRGGKKISFQEKNYLQGYLHSFLHRRPPPPHTQTPASTLTPSLLSSVKPLNWP